MKAAAAVLGASLIFFIGVLTGVGRREAVPPPAAIPLGAANAPAGSDTSGQPSPDDAPKGTTTTAANPSAPGTPSGTGGPTGSTVVTVTTATTATSSTTPSSTTTTRPGDVEQVDSQVNCRSQGEGKGKREPCPSTTTATGEAPGGGRNNR